MSYAIIELGGRQYRVEEGDSVLVDRIDAKEGAKVSPRALFWSDGGVMDGPDLEKVKIEAVVTEHLKGEKLRVFKYRPKKRYRKSAGHRSLQTRLEIKSIKAGVKAGIKAPTARAAKKAPAAKTNEKAKED